jgi:hypothetical protein
VCIYGMCSLQIVTDTRKVSLIARDYSCEHGLDFVGRRAKSSI